MEYELKVFKDGGCPIPILIGRIINTNPMHLNAMLYDCIVMFRIA